MNTYFKNWYDLKNEAGGERFFLPTLLLSAHPITITHSSSHFPIKKTPKKNMIKKSMKDFGRGKK